MSTRTVGDLAAAIESIAPCPLAEPWDNVGLLVGDPSRRLNGPVLLTIDLTSAVTDEALALKAGAVIAYHPPIFAPLNRLAATSPRSASLLRLIEAGVAIHSPHTALDAAPGGVTDWLLGLVTAPSPTQNPSARAIQAHRSLPSSQTFKLVVFVPADPPGLVDRVRAAMGEAGAGIIGAYRECSFAAPGAGSFLGGAGSNPAVGRPGRLEHVTELRLEMVCSERCLAPAIAALRREHPYEEPAFDILKLEPRPQAHLGAGRIADLEAPLRPSALALRLKASLGTDVTVQLAARSDDPVKTVGAVPGSGGSLADAAADAGCAVFITGEMKHHEVHGALDRGCAVILAGHTQTERGYLPILADRLRAALAGVQFTLSRQDTPPLRTV